VNALTPHGTSLGLQIGANALTLAYAPGFFSASVSAPWPPMLCPVMAARLGSSSGKCADSSAGSS
jgi:hypothetical protein